ncbi:MAG TPA: hypothetical protein VL418_05350 [Devosiaceae bacterium]|nr:hypothetical protein [Devosiaceae bacterium]
MILKFATFLTVIALSGAALTPAFAATAAMPANTMAAKPAAKTATVDPKRFKTEALASASCPTGTVVWANTRSKIFHLQRTATYGKGKNGTYMCQTDATAEGFKAPKKPEKMVSSAK